MPETRTRDPVLTLDEFAVLPPEDGYRLELSRGRLVREPAPGLGHSEVAGRIYRRLWAAAEEKGAGRVFFHAGFTLSRDPPTVRVPDVAFVRAARLPESVLPEGFGDGAPELAVEVLSPSNSASDIQRKALDYLDAGAALVWIVDPRERTVTVYRSPSDIRILGARDVLEGEQVLPDLRVPVGELFR
jgi:Uma2 family endonuclease